MFTRWCLTWRLFWDCSNILWPPTHWRGSADVFPASSPPSSGRPASTRWCCARAFCAQKQVGVGRICCCRPYMTTSFLPAFLCEPSLFNHISIFHIFNHIMSSVRPVMETTGRCVVTKSRTDSLQYPEEHKKERRSGGVDIPRLFLCISH